MGAQISDLDKAEVLKTLFDHAFVNGYCYENGTARTVEEAGFDRLADLTMPEAREYLERYGGNFVGHDVRGRWLEVDLSGGEVCLSQYAEHFGVSGEALIERLRGRSLED